MENPDGIVKICVSCGGAGKRCAKLDPICRLDECRTMKCWECNGNGTVYYGRKAVEVAAPKREYHVIGQFLIEEQVEVMAENEQEALRLARENCGRDVSEYAEVGFKIA